MNIGGGGTLRMKGEKKGGGWEVVRSVMF